MKTLYQFVIESQHQENGTQKELRDQVVDLLEIAPIYFTLSRDYLKKDKLLFARQEFTFETADEARQLALKILKTGHIFICSLKKIETK